MQNTIFMESELTSLPEDLGTASSAVALMLRLLYLHPLSHRPQAALCSGQLAQDKAIKDDATAHDCTLATADTQLQAAYRAQQWPTPKPKEWQDLQLIATRACTCLAWAFSRKVIQHTATDLVRNLTGPPCQLLQRLVFGHLPDLKVDMQKLL